MTSNENFPQARNLIKPHFSVLRMVLRNHVKKRAYLVWVPARNASGGFDKVPVDPVDGQVRAPNSARERGIMTLDEVERAVIRLPAEEGVPDVGIGLFPPHAQLTAIDLDRCIVDGKVADWVRPIIEGVYTEKSPSGTGLRLLVTGVSAGLTRRSNGAEKDGIGIYGEQSNKFVTLTGKLLHDGVPLKLEPLPEVNERAIWAHWEQASEKRLKAPAPDGTSNDGYARGRGGMDEALEAILTGDALHPAMVAYLTRAANLMGADEARDIVLMAYHDSDAKQTDPGRWQARANSCDGIIDWIKAHNGFRRDPRPSQEMDALRRMAKEALAKATGPEVEYAWWGGNNGAFNFVRLTDAEADDLFGWLGFERMPETEMVKLLGWDDWFELLGEWLELRGKDVPAHVAVVRQVNREAAQDAAELDQARAEAMAQQVLDDDPQAWLVEDCPSLMLMGMMQYLMACQSTPSYGVACAMGLVTAGVVVQNGVICAGSRTTGANIGCVVIEHSGGGKSVAADAVAEIAMLLGSVEVIGKPESAQGIYDAFLDSDGKLLMIIDEADDYLAAISDPRQAGGHIHKSVNVITDAFPRATNALPVSASARRNKTNPRPPLIHAPYLNLIMMTTPDHIPGKISGKVLRGGFFGRMLYLRTPALEDRMVPMGTAIPPDIAEALRRAAFAFHRPSVYSATREKGADAPPNWAQYVTTAKKFYKPIRLSNDQQSSLHLFNRRMQDEMGENRAIGSRSAELAIHVATAVAAWMQIDCAEIMGVELKDQLADDWPMPDEALAYAMRVVEQSLQCLARDVEMLENAPKLEDEEALQAIQASLIEAVIHRKGYYAEFAEDIDEGYIPLRFFTVRLKNRGQMRSRLRQDVIDTLQAMDWLGDEETIPSKRRPKQAFKLLPNIGKRVLR